MYEYQGVVFPSSFYVSTVLGNWIIYKFASTEGQCLQFYRVTHLFIMLAQSQNPPCCRYAPETQVLEGNVATFKPNFLN